jgi:hypothetical protein
MNPENWKRDQRLLGFRYKAFRVWIWAARDTLLFLVYERLDSESPQHIVRIPFAFVQMQVRRYSLCSKLQVILAFLDA